MGVEGKVIRRLFVSFVNGVEACCECIGECPSPLYVGMVGVSALDGADVRPIGSAGVVVPLSLPVYNWTLVLRCPLAVIGEGKEGMVGVAPSVAFASAEIALIVVAACPVGVIARALPKLPGVGVGVRELARRSFVSSTCCVLMG